MPKKKTGQRKKADKAKIRRRLVNSHNTETDLINHPCNVLMECNQCGKRQRNRAFCYFCQSIQRLPVCCHCGKQKCTGRYGDCLVKHRTAHVTGMAMVGAICDFCDAWVCHGSRCLNVHACECPMQDSACIECDRSSDEHGGRIFLCAFCRRTLCEDDQFEHQASCQRLEAEDYKCPSCNRTGTNACMRCKVVFCDDHVKRKGVKYERKTVLPCPKCGNPLTESYNLSISTRSYVYGRQQHQSDEEGDTGYGGGYQHYTPSDDLSSSDDTDGDEDASDDADEMEEEGTLVEEIKNVAIDD